MRYSGPGTVLWRSRPVLQATNCDFAVETNNNDITTLHLGRAGHSRGPRKVTVGVRSAIPEAGFEVDWIGVANAQDEVTLGFKIAGKTYECRGDVRSARVTTGADGANETSFDFHGIIVSEL